MKNEYNTIDSVNTTMCAELRDLILILSEWDVLHTEPNERIVWALLRMREFLTIHGMGPIVQYFKMPRSGIDDDISMDEALRVCYKVIGNDIFRQARNAKIFLEDVVRSLPHYITINEIVNSCRQLWKEKYILRACRKSFRLEEVAQAMSLCLCSNEGMNAAHLAGYTGTEIARAGFVLKCPFWEMLSCRRQGHYSFVTLCWVYMRSIIGKVFRF